MVRRWCGRHTRQRNVTVVKMFFFFFNDTATTEIYTLSLHDALPIYKLVAQKITAKEVDVESLEHIGIVELGTLVPCLQQCLYVSLFIKADHRAGHPGLVPGDSRNILVSIRKHVIEQQPFEKHVRFQQYDVLGQMLPGKPQRIDVVSRCVAVGFDVGYLHPIKGVPNHITDLSLKVPNNDYGFFHTYVRQMSKHVDEDRYTIYGCEAFGGVFREWAQATADAGGKDDGFSYRGVWPPAGSHFRNGFTSP